MARELGDDGGIDYLLVATLTRDLTPDGLSLGGTAAFSACMARALGRRVGLVSRFANDVDLGALEGVRVARQAAPVTTTFENRYEAEGRVQRLHRHAGDIALDAVPEAWLAAPIVHVGPLAQDIDRRMMAGFPCALVGVTPQGWLRRWRADGRIEACDWAEPGPVLERADAIVLSIEDAGEDWSRIEAWAERAALLVVTEAERGASVFHGQGRQRFAAPAVDVRDPTGAGDLFAAAYFVLYAAERDALGAAERCVWLTSMLLARRGGRFPSRALVEALLAEQRA